MKKFFYLLLSLTITSAAFSQTTNSEVFTNPTISVGVVVSDLEKSLDFYTHVIGMVKTREFSVDRAKADRMGLTDNKEINVTVLKLIDDDTSTEWKLLNFGNKASHPKQRHIHDDTGMQYTTIFVSNLKPFVDRIKEHNIEILSEIPTKLAENRYFILIQDPDGIFIELIGDYK